MTPDRVVCPVHQEVENHCNERHGRLDRLISEIFKLADDIKARAEDNRVEAIKAVHDIGMKVAKIVGVGVVIQIVAAAFLLALFTKWLK